MATTKKMLAELLAVQKMSADRIQALALTLATLQETIAALDAGADPALLADVQAALTQAQANDAALVALTNPQGAV